MSQTYQVDAEEHRFSLVVFGRLHLAGERVRSGLIEPLRNGVGVITGIYSGPVDVCVNVHEHDPGVDLDAWEDIAVSCFLYDGGDLRLVGDDWTGDPVAVPGDPPVIAARVCAKGRDRMPDLQADEAVERYLIQLWPLPASEQIQARDDRLSTHWGLGLV